MCPLYRIQLETNANTFFSIYSVQSCIIIKVYTQLLTHLPVDLLSLLQASVILLSNELIRLMKGKTEGFLVVTSLWSSHINPLNVLSWVLWSKMKKKTITDIL